jgi:peptide/nickel transport system permease protein
VLGLSDLGSPTIGTMIYWAGYYQALLAKRFWWLGAPIITSILLVVSMYLISISLGRYLDPRSRLKAIAARAA